MQEQRVYRPIIGAVDDALKVELIYNTRLAYVFERRRHAVNFRETGTYSPSPKWDGGRQSDGKVTKSYWVSIADFLRQHKLNPYAAYEVLFEKNVRASHAPIPSLLTSMSLLPDYEQATEEVRSKVRKQLNDDTNLARSRVVIQQTLGDNRRQSVINVLVQSHLPISPLFRYCLAFSEGLEVSELYVPAFMQMMRARQEYEAEWEDILPIQLCAMSQAERLNMLRKLNT